MGMDDVALQLIDPRVGDQALVVEPLSIESGNEWRQRVNRFAMVRIERGRGTFSADLGAYAFEPGSLLFAVPYQAVRVVADEPIAGDVVGFHANFFCIETYHDEVGCNGVLFNDLYGTPVVRLDSEERRAVDELFESIRRELRDAGLAHREVLLSYLKILLVRATRLKLEQQDLAWNRQPQWPAAIDDLKRLVEENFRTLHRPGQYAERLHLTPKSLAKLAKAHLGKTVTELIRERLMNQAKWELLHTRRPIKQIAFELGFRDVFYFSRLFRQSTGCSPTDFREYETAVRGGRNVTHD
jgi:AraC family transcriptional activator of pobA